MINYIRREIKFLLYLSLIFVVVLVLLPFIFGQKSPLTLEEFMYERRIHVFMGLLLAYALVYPVIAYTSVKRHINGSFEANREIFEKAFDTLEYIKISESSEKIVYRKKSAYTRFIQWYEDAIVVFPGENPVIMEGLRKSVTRIDRIIDHMLLKADQ